MIIHIRKGLALFAILAIAEALATLPLFAAQVDESAALSAASGFIARSSGERFSQRKKVRSALPVSSRTNRSGTKATPMVR